MPFGEYYRRIESAHLAPLWERLPDLLPAEPRVRSKPFAWRYDSLRPLLLESAELIGEEEAERRVLILENPGLAGESAITESLFAGLQLIMPGELAAAHRHTPGALRFILESADAYTSVEDERVEMHRGDVILTPSWCWHGHGNEGSAPAVWLDVLDLPAVRSLGPRFAERRNESDAGRLREGQSLYRYGMNMAPADARAALGEGGLRSPIVYPYARSREALERSKRDIRLDPVHGLKMEYINPSSGGAVLPSISAFLQLLPSGFSGETYRTTEGIVYCVAEGRGRVSIGAGDAVVEFGYAPNDVVAVPCWEPHAFAATEETVLFSASDRVAQMRLGLWREHREPSS